MNCFSLKYDWVLLLYLLRIRGFALCWACTDQSCTDQFFFCGESVGFCFQYIGLFFPCGLACYKIFLFPDFSSKIFWAFFFLVGLLEIFLRVFLILIEGVPNFFFKG